MSETSLKITEIFFSLQGEARTCGKPTVFVRLTGCPLRCGYCDSEYAFFGGKRMAITDILDEVKAYGAQHVCVTGGEPLAQPNCLYLLEELCQAGLYVSLETSGAMDITGVDSQVDIVMDLKTPDSSEVNRNKYENIAKLAKKDQIKFVICSERDYEWAKFKLDEYSLDQVVGEVLFSPSHGQVSPKDLADWIIRDRLNVRFQMQLHKLLWGDIPGV